jgi:undecaprenyl diphosphate synthase
MKSCFPNHIAFIVDGNRRWAKKNNKPAILGHRYVVDKTLDEIIVFCLNKKIAYVTFWAFSTENWKRGQKFAAAIFKLLTYALEKSFQKYLRDGVRFNTIGDLSKIPSNLADKIRSLEKRSQDNDKLTVTIALNYGGRDDILRAVKKLVKSKKFDKNNIDKLTESDFANFLDTHDLPDPDLIIRTGGDKRLSGFLSWQNQYSELVFTNTLMPDFSTQEFDKILEDFCQRDRRYGGDTKK